MPPPTADEYAQMEQRIREGLGLAIREAQAEDAYIFRALEAARRDPDYSIIRLIEESLADLQAVLQRQVEQSSAHDLETLQAWARQVEAQGGTFVAPSHLLRPERLLMSRQDWEDIVNDPAFSGSGGEVTITGGTGSATGTGGEIQISGGRVGFQVREELGAAIVNPAGLRRVQVPEFELFSNPTIRIDEVRSRRFNLMDRGLELSRMASRLIEAVIRAKAPPPEPSRYEQIYGDPRTAWEVLVDPALVDASSP